MTEIHTDRFEYFVSANSNRETDGSAARPFRTLDDALAKIGEQANQFNPDDGRPPPRREFEIVCLERPGDPFRPKKRARYQFYIDPQDSNSVGSGSELDPWAGLGSAIVALTEKYKSGELKPQAGQQIRILTREVFTATAVERRKNFKETIARFSFMSMAFVLVLPVVAILSYLLIKAWPVLDLRFLLDNPMERMTAGGIWAPLVGTFFLVLISLLIAAPIGVLAGVYLNEYAPDNWMTRLIQLAVVNLAGVPSIVHGLFGVGAFVHFAHMNRSLLAASCTVAVMTLPVIITSTKEALAAVPTSFREACWNMGASRWQTIRTIVLPNSFTGILTGVILQVARAAGETAPVLFTGAVYFVKIDGPGVNPLMPYGLGDRFMALSYHLWTLSTQVQDVPEEVLYGTAVVLIGLVLVVNSLSIGLRVYLRSQKKW